MEHIKYKVPVQYHLLYLQMCLHFLTPQLQEIEIVIYEVPVFFQNLSLFPNHLRKPFSLRYSELYCQLQMFLSHIKFPYNKVTIQKKKTILIFFPQCVILYNSSFVHRKCQTMFHIGMEQNRDYIYNMNLYIIPFCPSLYFR